MLILLYVKDEVSFDKFHNNALFPKTNMRERSIKTAIPGIYKGQGLHKMYRGSNVLYAYRVGNGILRKDRKLKVGNCFLSIRPFFLFLVFPCSMAIGKHV